MKIVFLFVITVLSAQMSFSQSELNKTDLPSFLISNQINYDDVEGYPVILSIANTAIRDNINHRIQNILVDQIETDTFKIELRENLMNSLLANFNILNNSKDATDFFTDKSYKPIIKDKEYHLSYRNSILTFLALYHYSVDIQSNKDVRKFNNTYYKIYYFDTETGKEYGPKDVFNKQLKKGLDSLISKKVEQKINSEFNNKLPFEKIDFLFPYQYADIDEEYVDSDTLKIITHKIVDASISDFGIMFPKPLSVEYVLPSWSSISHNVTPVDVSIKIKNEELIKYINPNGPFKNLISERRNPEKTILKNNNNPPLSMLYNWDEFGVDIFAPFQDSIKKTTIYRDVEYNGHKRNHLFEEIFRHKNGLIDSIQFFGFDEQYNTKPSTAYTFHYDDNDNLIKISSGGNELWNYEYDENRNLIYSKDEFGETFYKYFNDFYVTESYSNERSFGFFREIKQFDTNNKLIKSYIGDVGLNHIEYRYDKNNNLIAELGKYLTEKVWYKKEFKYDSKGKIIYSNLNDRDTLTYIYDNLGRLVERIYFTGSTYNVWLEYNEKNKPIKITTNRIWNSELYTYYISYNEW